MGTLVDKFQLVDRRTGRAILVIGVAIAALVSLCLTAVATISIIETRYLGA